MSPLLEIAFTQPKADQITASGHALDLSSDKFGVLRDSSTVAFVDESPLLWPDDRFL